VRRPSGRKNRLRGVCADILSAIRDRPISLEVFADEFDEMERQARLIASWGSNVYVKIPVTNTRREPALDLMHRPSHAGIRLNVTALLTLDQVRDVAAALAGGSPCCVSVFAGRIADTGRDPVPLMAAPVELVSIHPGMELIWASPRGCSTSFSGGFHRMPHHHRRSRRPAEVPIQGRTSQGLRHRNRPQYRHQEPDVSARPRSCILVSLGGLCSIVGCRRGFWEEVRSAFSPVW